MWSGMMNRTLLPPGVRYVAQKCLKVFPTRLQYPTYPSTTLVCEKKMSSGSSVSICASLVNFTVFRRSDMMWFDVKMMWFWPIIPTSSPRTARYVAQKCWTLFPTCPRWSTYPETSGVYQKKCSNAIYLQKWARGYVLGRYFGGGLWNTVYTT